MREGIHIKFYLPNLSDAELTVAVECANVSHAHAPKFATWLADALMDEQTRRIRSSVDTVPRETELLILAAADWSARELTDAVKATTAMSYGVRSEGVGRLADRLAKVFVSAVCARLMIAEGLLIHEH